MPGPSSPKGRRIVWRTVTLAAAFVLIAYVFLGGHHKRNLSTLNFTSSSKVAGSVVELKPEVETEETEDIHHVAADSSGHEDEKDETHEESHETPEEHPHESEVEAHESESPVESHESETASEHEANHEVDEHEHESPAETESHSTEHEVSHESEAEPESTESQPHSEIETHTETDTETESTTEEPKSEETSTEDESVAEVKVKKTITDVSRWHKKDSFKKDWDVRARGAGRLIRAFFSKSPERKKIYEKNFAVLDIGSGPYMSLHKFLPEDSTYISADIVRRAPEMFVLDLNLGENEVGVPNPDGDIPESLAAIRKKITVSLSMVSMLGVAEYIVDFPRLFVMLKEFRVPVLITYHSLEAAGGSRIRSRKERGWVNHLHYWEFENFFLDGGFDCEKRHSFFYWILPRSDNERGTPCPKTDRIPIASSWKGPYSDKVKRGEAPAEVSAGDER
mmetsp:Transcript_36595/g.59176  ORF Transcript_36595/g.59176 Transcript_36595/m.59176 type:complete len:452 (+) Transcript_36595:104-1459(+)